jgi:uncharacterized protein GlcG (DUF336 family)
VTLGAREFEFCSENVAILDDRGDLKAFSRMDGAAILALVSNPVPAGE